MNSLSRIVEGWMGEKLYRKLGNVPDIELAWELIRELVGHQLFESEYVTVPQFDSAIYYNEMFVFKKKRSLLSCLGLAAPTYKMVGNLDYLVDRDVSTWTPQFDFSPWDVADGLDLYKEYRLNVLSNVPDEVKSIELVVLGLHAREVPAPPSGSLKIRRNLLEDLERVKCLYVIDEVIFASYIRLHVRIGPEHSTKVYDVPSTPIAFKYRKYKVSPDGQFEREMYTTLKTGDKDAVWIRPLPQPVPWWPQICGSFAIKKKTRSNLTIPTLGNTNRTRRQTWAREAGAFRFERSAQENENNNAQDDQDLNRPRNSPVRIQRAMTVANLSQDEIQV